MLSKIVIIVCLTLLVRQIYSIAFKHPIFKSLDPQSLEDFKEKIIETVREYNEIQLSKFKFNKTPLYTLPEDEEIISKITKLNNVYDDWVQCRSMDLSCNYIFNYYYISEYLTNWPDITEKVELANRFLKILSPFDRIHQVKNY